MKSKTTSYFRNRNLIQFFIGILFLTGINSTAQNIYSVLNESWISSDWQKETQTLNTYDSSNYLTNSLTQTWVSSSGSWENSLQINYTNNPDGTANLSVMQSWDSGSSSWNDVQQSMYTYNAAKKVLTHTSQIWVGYWLNSSKTTNTYDGSGYLINTLNQNWDYITATWKNANQTNFSNNPNGTVNQSVKQIWNASNVWVNSERISYTYTAGNKVLYAITEIWGGINWLIDSRETNTYDASGYLINSLLQQWSGFSAVWINDTQSIFTNTPSGTPTQIVTQTWDTNTSTWNNATRITFGYTLGISEFAQERGFVLYPNPSTDLITVKLSDSFSAAFSITDQTGRIVKNGELNSETTSLNIGDLAKGVYFFRIGKTQKSYLKFIKN